LARHPQRLPPPPLPLPRLRELTRRLEAQLAFGESFAADLSHELKNPLASIRAAAELIPEAGDGERARFLGVIQKEVARLEALLARVRDIFRVRAPADRPLVRVAPHRFLQVLENLLDNAASFATPGTDVEVTVRRQGAWAVLCVADHGPGIPPEHLQRIFDRFFSYRPMDGYRPAAGADKTPNPRGEHPGLGLAIVKSIVEGYSGTVCASNREGGGAVFEVRLLIGGKYG
jgi:two-component system sensor histidine kinase ChvG